MCAGNTCAESKTSFSFNCFNGNLLIENSEYTPVNSHDTLRGQHGVSNHDGEVSTITTAQEVLDSIGIFVLPLISEN
jgi:hypothetical protein